MNEHPDLKILLIEDNAGDARLISVMLEDVQRQHISISHADTLAGGCSKLHEGLFDVVLLDIGLPDSTGIDSIEAVKKRSPELPIIMLTGLDDEETAISSLKMGAQDYLVKGRIDTGLLLRSIRYAIERKKAEEQIRTSLEEKELLLREIHHRVKNNMTVVFSLLKLQSRHVRDERDRKLFEDSMARIKSMALIHEKLYRTGNLAEINFRDYISELTGSMFMSYRIPSGRIRLKTDVDNVSLGIDTAIPCGLIINELLSNSLKYAFPEGASGELRVSLHEISDPGAGDADLDPASEIELIVGDNGTGMPEEIDIGRSDSLGLSLVNAFVRQISGKIEVSRENGTEYRIRFEKPKSGENNG